MKINKERGAYLYEKNGKIKLFTYMKLAKDKISSAVSLTTIPHSSNYLTVVLDNHVDYTGHCNYNDVIDMIIKNNMHSLLQNNYTELKKKIPKLTVAIYYDNLKFAHDQLNILNCCIIVIVLSLLAMILLTGSCILIYL